MSEYQYYEFQAVDRLLDAQARAKLRDISTRARITSSSFVNHYDWGDLKADPLNLLERYFDLFLYFANWGTRQLAMKLPARLVDMASLQRFKLDEDLALVRRRGDHVILSIRRDELEYEDWEEDGTGWLASLAPLRTELLAGDFRLFSLLWLIQVECELVDDDATEPVPGLASCSPALAALADFLCIDGNLLEAATGATPAVAPAEEASNAEIERLVRTLPEKDKVALLVQLHRGSDPHLGLELRRRLRTAELAPPVHAPCRSAGELRAAACRIEAERQRLVEEKAAAELRRQQQAAARAREKRLQALIGREDGAWREAESLIGQRNPKGYDQAAALLADLEALADKNDAYEGFARRLAELRERHAGKRNFIARLDGAGLKAKPALPT